MANTKRTSLKPLAHTMIINAGQLLTMHGDGKPGPKAGRGMSELGIIKDGAVAIAGSRVIAVGPTAKLRKLVRTDAKTRVIDAQGRLVTPGLIDSHTHPVFAGSRVTEFEMRVAGKSYLEIAQAGGGIKATVKATRKASPDSLFENGQRVLKEMLSWGTTTVEAKSGYGLTLKDEVKILKVLARLNQSQPVEIVPTFLGAHHIPEEYASKPDEYVALVCDVMIPTVMAGQLAEFCDVFCEKGVFSARQTRVILQTAQAFGLKVKLHADQFHSTGGAEMAAEFGAVSADHLEHVSQEGIHLMKKAGVIAVLLPGSVFYLNMERKPPAREMIDYGLPVALATDFNPGSSPIHSLPLIMSLACVEFKMTPAEVWVAVTLNAAFAVARGDRVGSLVPGKMGDLVIWGAEDYREIPYWCGKNLVHQVLKGGQQVWP